MSFVKIFIAFCIAAGFILEPPPVLLTVYDPALGGINCGQSCHVLADGHHWDQSDYESVAACPSWMVYTGETKMWIDANGMSLACRDTGSMVRIAWNSHYESYVIHIDVMYPVAELGYPEWNYMLIDFEDVEFYWNEVE